MWKELPRKNKDEYKKMILAFASLTEMFDQKGDEEKKSEERIPVVNSKYQEKVFQAAFKAHGEDKENTSYDASLLQGTKKYVIGIKTFGYKSGAQKVAQFKASENEWMEDINLLRKSRYNADGTERTINEINAANEEIYRRIAVKLAGLRNMRIRSSIKNLEGFEADIEDDDIESVYHVLMPRVENGVPRISVGETAYNLIDLDSLEIIGCSTKDKPDNFSFRDKYHRYRFTPADSQLLMNFKNNEIVIESWDVKYADDAYAIFAGIAESLYKEEPAVKESYCWHITNKKGEVEKFSGFNGFYGTGSKLSLESREERIRKFERDFYYLPKEELSYYRDGLREFLLERAGTLQEKEAKAEMRQEMMSRTEKTGNAELYAELKKIMYRPVNEMYIPLPTSRKFHDEHPDFFVKGGFKFNKAKMIQTPEERTFNLVFEPSGDSMTAFISQDDGKAIESTESMGKLGEWILRRVFQLDELEPLTVKRLNEIGINGIRLEKYSGSDDIHLSFIWIEPDATLPADYWK